MAKKKKGGTRYRRSHRVDYRPLQVSVPISAEEAMDTIGNQKIVRKRHVRKKPPSTSSIPPSRAYLFKSSPKGLINPLQNPSRARLMRCKNAMEIQGYSSYTSSKQRTNLMAQDVLYSFGCELISSFDQKVSHLASKDFSLVATQTAEVKIQNQKITPSLIGATPTARPPKEKFKNDADPFYTLDGPRPEHIARADRLEKQLKMPDLITVAGHVYTLHHFRTNSKYLSIANRRTYERGNF